MLPLLPGSNTMLPQSPGAGLGDADPKVIGAAAVPTAWSVPRTIRPDFALPNANCTDVPGRTVIVVPVGTIRVPVMTCGPLVGIHSVSPGRFVVIGVGAGVSSADGVSTVWASVVP